MSKSIKDSAFWDGREDGGSQLGRIGEVEDPTANPRAVGGAPLGCVSRTEIKRTL